MSDKNIPIGTPQSRTFDIVREAVEEAKREVRIAFSSEVPYQRFWGLEILSHDKGAIRLDRLNKGGAVLFNHDIDELHGLITDISIDPDKRGRGTVIMSKKANSEALFQDIKDGILNQVSVGYIIHATEDLDAGEKNLAPEAHRILVTDWEPYEVSFVSVAADITVGVGRNFNNNKLKEGPAMEPRITLDEGAITPEMKEKAEKDRVTEIETVAREFGDRIEGGTREMERLKGAAMRLGVPSDVFKGDIYTRVNDKKPITLPKTHLDLSGRDKGQYSFIRLLSAIAAKDPSLAPFEYECSAEIQKRLEGRQPEGVFVPYDMQPQRRDLLVGTSSAGGYTVQTDVLAGEFLPYLWARLFTRNLGATMLTGLRGPVAIPRQSASSTLYWVAENTAVTESQQTFDQVTLGPKTVGTFTDIARRLLLQSSIDIEGFVRNEIARNVTVGIDNVAINGTGAPQPTGILGTSGIGDFPLGTNGAAPTFAMVVGLWKEIAKDNADFGTLAWLTNPDAWAKMMQVAKITSTDSKTLIENLPGTDGFGVIQGLKAAVSTLVPNNLVKGTSGAVCSALLIGNWTSLLIGEWGVMDILIDPITGGAAGTLRVRVLMDIDIAVRYPQSFAACKDMLTT